MTTPKNTNTIFINQTLEFLQKSDILESLLTFGKVQDKGDGTKVLSLTVSFGSDQESPTIQENICLNILTIFSLLDTFVDMNYPTLMIDRGFPDKYNLLPDTTDKETILKETYGILRHMRNCIVHDINNAAIWNDSSGKYSFCKKATKKYTAKIIDISEDDIKNLNTIVLLLVDDHYSIDIGNYDFFYLSPSYIELLLKTYYQSLYKHLYTQPPLKPLKDKKILSGIEREVFIEHPFNESEGTISFLEHSSLDYSTNRDYWLKYQGNDYLIPAEILDDMSIATKDLQNWKLKRIPSMHR